MDEIVQVTNDDAFNTSRNLTKEEGILAGISSGANMYAAIQIAQRSQKDTLIVVILPDTGERYISTELFR